MIDEILKQLKFITKKEKDELKNLVGNNTEDYFYNAFDKLMNEWNKEYPLFDIPSGMVSIKVNDNTLYLPYGNNKYTKDTIFDIASMTKLYTEMILFDVIDDYDIKLDNKISDLVDFYKDIDYLTIRDLISFNNDYRTKIDIRECTNKKEALNALRTAYIVPEGIGLYKYTDLPIMILTDILETYTGIEYKDLFNKYIIDKYNLKHTYLDINDDNFISINKNMTNDPKANIMGGYYGHCGVKATSEDFIKFLSQVLDSKHKDLFLTTSLTKNPDGTIRTNKALLGNVNLPTKGIETLASAYLPKEGFAIQGSVRCHGETCNFYIDGKEYRITISIFMDLYLQYDNMKKYEKETDSIYTKEYEVEGKGLLKMCDVRNVMKYTTHYKSFINMVGVCKILELYKYIKK